MYSLSEKVGKLSISVEFKDNLCVLADDSGTGKSYVMGLLYHDAVKRGFSAVLVTYVFISSTADAEDAIVSLIKDKDVVLLDNADLYLTERICEEAKKAKVLCLIATRFRYKYNLPANSVYLVDYTGSELTVSRW